jgi:ribosomal protein L37AE/L43A
MADCERCGKPLPRGQKKFHIECMTENVRELVKEMNRNTVFCPHCNGKNLKRIGNKITLRCEHCGEPLYE